MTTVGIFEAKTKLAELCERVASTGQAVTITRRGKPLVRIDPIEDAPSTIRERRDAYMAGQGQRDKKDGADFDVPPRSRELMDVDVGATL